MNDQIRTSADTTPHITPDTTSGADSSAAASAATAAAAAGDRGSPRAYEQSGCYPAEGKSFRLWALLGWLSLVIIALAVAAAVLNIYFLGAPWKAG